MMVDSTVREQDPDDVPPPGSPRARAEGCTCSAPRNNHGRRAPFKPGSIVGGSSGGWVVSTGCPVHAGGSWKGVYLFDGTVPGPDADSRDG